MVSLNIVHPRGVPCFKRTTAEIFQPMLYQELISAHSALLVLITSLLYMHSTLCYSILSTLARMYMHELSLLVTFDSRRCLY